MALEDPDIELFTSEEEGSESQVELGPTPIPSSSQQEQGQQLEQKEEEQQEHMEQQKKEARTMTQRLEGEGSESQEELGSSPIPSSSQQEQQQQPEQEQQQWMEQQKQQREKQQQLEHQRQQQQQHTEAILPSSQHDADGTQQTQEQSNDGSQEELSQAILLELETWKQKIDEAISPMIAQCRTDMAELRDNQRGELGEERAQRGRLEVDYDSEGGNKRVALSSGGQHQVEVEVESNQDKADTHRQENPLATGMRNFLKLEQMLEQIQEKKQQVEKEIEERVGSLAEARQRNAMLIEAKERISQHMKAHKKKVHDLL